MIKVNSLNDELKKRISGYLGLAQKAGKIAAGDMAVMNAIKNGSAKLIIVAIDIAPSVLNEFRHLLLKKSIPVYSWEEKDYLGLIVGKSRRGALAVLDKGFADAIEKLFQVD